MPGRVRLECPVAPARLIDPVARLMGLLASAPARRHVLGLAGYPGSGKTTLAARLARMVNNLSGRPDMVSLGMDGFHLSRTELSRARDPVAALARRGAPWTFDAAALAQRLRAVRAAGTASHTVCWPAFEHGTGDPVDGAITVAPTVSIVLVEGLYLLHRGEGWDLDSLFDECWFLDVALPLALERLALRHMATRGLDRTQALARIAANDRLNAELVLQSRIRADWLVPGDAT